MLASHVAASNMDDARGQVDEVTQATKSGLQCSSILVCKAGRSFSATGGAGTCLCASCIAAADRREVQMPGLGTQQTHYAPGTALVLCQPLRSPGMTAGMTQLQPVCCLALHCASVHRARMRCNASAPGHTGSCRIDTWRRLMSGPRLTRCGTAGQRRRAAERYGLTVAPACC